MKSWMVLVLWLGAGIVQGLADEPATPVAIAKAFAVAQGDAMQRVAAETETPVPAVYTQLLAAVVQNDWLAVSNVFIIVKKSIGQYEGSHADPGLHNALWQYALEVYGAYEQVAHWDATLLELYAQDLLRLIPENAVYLGGTDPGRFVISMYQTVQKKPFYVITQNALADNTYMDYLRGMLGEKLNLPDQKACNTAFQEYVSDVQAGRIPAGADVSFENGRVTVQGIQGVMMINGILARKIFDRNNGDHAFYLEESYVIPWMYPYLEPAGLIMKLNAEVVELSDETIAADRQYWDAYVAKLKAIPAFGQDEWAQKTFSKMRSGIGGLYAYRRNFAEAEYAFKQALELYPISPEGNFRLAELYLQQNQDQAAHDLISTALKLDPANEIIAGFLRQIEQKMREDAPAPAEEEAAP